MLIHNAVGGAFGNFMEIDPQVLNRNFQVNTMALLYLARLLAPDYDRRGRRRDHRQRQHFGAAGQTCICGIRTDQGRAANPRRVDCAGVGPKGVHVAYVLIDAVIDLEWTRKRFAGASRRLLYQADGDRRRNLACCASGSVGVVFQCRGQAVSRNLVTD